MELMFVIAPESLREIISRTHAEDALNVVTKFFSITSRKTSTLCISTPDFENLANAWL
jgi:hypothetical protein